MVRSCGGLYHPPGVIIVSKMRAFLILVSSVCLSGVATASPQRTPPPSPEAPAAYYFMLGRHLESTGKVDEAIAALKHAIALAPDQCGGIGTEICL